MTRPASAGPAGRAAMQRHALGAHRELHRPLAGAAAREVEIEVAEPDQRALAALLEELGIDQVGVADEVGDEQAHRLLVELDRRSGLRDAAVMHHDDAVGDGERLLLVVRHIGDGEVEIELQLADLLAHAPAQLGIEVRQRLVEQQHLRLQISARATATRCCCPPESSDGARFSSPASPTRASFSFTSSRIFAFGMPCTVGP